MKPGTLWLSAASLLAVGALAAFAYSEDQVERTDAALAGCVRDCSFGVPFDHAYEAFAGRLVGLALVLGASVLGVVGWTVRRDPMWH